MGRGLKVSPTSAWPVLRKAHLQSDVLGLIAHSHPGDAREINEGQIWDLRGGDLQIDELVADANSIPGYGILGYGG